MAKTGNHYPAHGGTHAQRLKRFSADPMGSALTATGALLGSFALVLSGIGAIHVAMH